MGGGECCEAGLFHPLITYTYVSYKLQPMLLYDRSFVKGNYSIFPYVLRENCNFWSPDMFAGGAREGLGSILCFFLDCHESVEWKKGDLTSLISSQKVLGCKLLRVFSRF